MILKTNLSLLLAVITFFVQPLMVASQINAQIKACHLTRIGPNAPREVVYPPGCVSTGGVAGSCGNVVDFAQQINDALNPNDNLTREISSTCGKSTPRSAWVDNTYWCAYTVVDSHNIAGIPGLSGASVIGLHDQMSKNSAYVFADYRTNKEQVIRQIKPGWAFFIEGTFGRHIGGQQHTGIIKSIRFDERGNGEIVTLESNAGKKSKTWIIANWVVQHGDRRPLVAFGGIK